MLNVILRMVIIILIIIVGILLRRTRLLPEDADRILSTLVIYIANPALIFYSVLSNDMVFSRMQTLQYIGICFLFYFVLIVVGKVFSYCPFLKEIPKKHLEAMLIFTNMGFIGLPVIQSIYGDGAVFYIALLGIPFNILVYSYGVYLLRKEESFSCGNIINPSMITAVIVLIFYFFKCPIPQVIMDFAQMLGNMTVPMALIVVGFNLAKESVEDVLKDKKAYLFVVLKLYLYPAVLWLLFHSVIKNKIFMGVMVIVAAMPVGSNVSMINREYGAECDGGEIAKCTVLSTVLSILSIPLWAVFLLR